MPPVAVPPVAVPPAPMPPVAPATAYPPPYPTQAPLTQAQPVVAVPVAAMAYSQQMAQPVPQQMTPRPAPVRLMWNWAAGLVIAIFLIAAWNVAQPIAQHIDASDWSGIDRAEWLAYIGAFMSVMALILLASKSRGIVAVFAVLAASLTAIATLDVARPWDLDLAIAASAWAFVGINVLAGLLVIGGLRRVRKG